MSQRFASALFVGAVGLLIASACGSEDTSEFGSSGGSSGNFSSSSGSIGGSSGTSGNVDDLAACATETLKGEALPLDIHIMLDASGSMISKTGANGNGPSKWDAVKTALKGFVADPSSAGVGVGLQIFPIVHAGAPASCTNDGQCAGGFGSCFLKACDYHFTNGPLVPCDSSADCPGNAACGSILSCPQKAEGFCVSGATGYWACPQQCKNAPPVTQSVCSKQECFLEDYDDARVPIAALPGAAGTINSSIDGIPTPKPTNLTPTSAALTGALAYAKDYAGKNAGHAVIVVLATDGLPTRCSPYDAAKISAIAASGVGGTPSVKTFVVGVFADAEKAEAQANLDQIAAGGGTGKALVVNTSGNVTADFQAAMNQIRGQALPCDYKIPSPQSGTPDYGRVNVKFTKGDGTAAVFPQAKGGAGSCDANGGWYYDVDPSSGATPTKITLCPASCDAVKTGGAGSKVDVLLGCTTIVK